MAKKEATLILKIKKIGGSVLKSTENALSSLAQGVMRYGAALGAMGTAIGAAAVKAGKFDGVQKSFIKLAQAQGQVADDMLKKMRELSQGTISDLKLMEQANTAALLGLPVDRIGDMLKIAQSASVATGQSMEFMTNSIVTGLGRQSKMILDNLGIVFSAEQANANYAKQIGKTAAELTDAERKQAFINEALRIGAENAEKTGMKGLTLSQMWEKVTAGAENATVAIGQAATPAIAFFGEQALSVFNGLNTAATQNQLIDFFQNTAKVVTVVKNMFVTFGEVVGTSIASVAGALSNLIRGNFSKAKNMIMLGYDEIGEALKKNVETTGQELEAIDQRFAEARIERARREESAKLEIKKEAAEQKKQFDVEQFEADQERLAEQKQREIDLIGASEQQKIDIEIAALEKRLENEKTVQGKKDLWQKKQDLLEQKRQEALRKFEEDQQKQRVANLSGTLSTIATLQQSNNKTLATIGKAAAIAQIAIQAPVGISRALASAPPPINFVLAGLVGAAFAAQAAAVSGVALAEGGIVPAVPGGIQATIGEGGRSEAVVPLPDDFDPDDGLSGGGNTFIFNGPIMGDSNQAKEFALMLDEELYKLRKNNESISFDQGIV